MQVRAEIVNSPSLAVRYTDRIFDGPLPAPPDHIEILVPGELGVFEARYRGADGRTRRAEVRAPFVSVIAPNQRLELQCHAPGDLVVLSIPRAFLESRAREAAAHVPDLNDRYETADPFLRRVGNVLRSGFRLRRPPPQTYLESLAGAIADHLTTQYGGKELKGGRGLAPHRVQRVRTLIHERLGDPIQVDDLADSINMSTFHFARMFKQATGESPHSYITRLRMEEAKRLLGETTVSLADIAKKVGYRTQAHFTGVFHERTGTTPRAYRLATRKKQG